MNPAMIVTLLISLIENGPKLAQASMDAFNAIKALWANGVDPTTAELDALMVRCLRAGADLRAVVAARTAPGGDWYEEPTA